MNEYLVLFLHISFLGVWLAGIFYLPYLLYEHHLNKDSAQSERLRRMERLLYFGLMTPAAVLTVIFGSVLMLYGFTGGWLPLKLTLVILLVIFHIYAGKIMMAFLHGQERFTRRFYWRMHWVPFLIILPILYLVLAKPI